MMGSIRIYKLLIVNALIIGCSQTKNFELSTESQIPSEALLQDYEDITGLQKGMVKADDIILAEGDFLHGLHHGTWTEYDSKGKVKAITTYLNGKKQGAAFIFDNQGYIQNKAYYHDDLLNGEFLVYSRRSITERRNYLAGSLHGLQQRFYPDGVLMEEKNYVNNIVDGVANWYDKEGNLIIKYVYDMGELVEE